MLGILALVNDIIFKSQNECGGLTLRSIGQDNESDLCSTGDVPTIFQGDEVSHSTLSVYAMLKSFFFIRTTTTVPTMES